uniref:Transposase-associated domain-containing protein n=1 Tax=Oryza brachyantha TaxID=4533 RepID=J3N751_ORYBR
MAHWWMYNSKFSSKEYIQELAIYVSTTKDFMVQNKTDCTLCPCVDCKNKRRLSIAQIHEDLMTRENGLEQMLDDGREDEYKMDNGERQKFDRMRQDNETLFFGGSKVSKLQAVLSLLHLKASNNWSDNSFTDLLSFLKDILPDDHRLSESIYQAKKVIYPLGLEVQKIHACSNGCILNLP